MIKRILPLILFLTIISNSFSQEDFSFERYLHEKQLCKELTEYYYQDSLSKSDINTILKKSDELNFQSLQYQKSQARYNALKEEHSIEKAKSELENMVFLGYNLHSKNDSIFIDLINQDSIIKKRNEATNYVIFDFFYSIKKELYTTKDSITFSLNRLALEPSRRKIDSFINSYDSWIGYDVRGPLHFYKSIFGNGIELLTWNMDEVMLNKYYKQILPNCQENNENWTLAQSLKSGQLSTGRQNKYYSKNKIRGLDLSFEGLNFKDDNTLLTINLLSLIAQNITSAKKLNIYPTALWGGSDYYKYTTSLIDKLLLFGAEFDSINLVNEVIPMDENEEIANDYYFVFEVVDK